MKKEVFYVGKESGQGGIRKWVMWEKKSGWDGKVEWVRWKVRVG